jgi:hypothetical protein
MKRFVEGMDRGQSTLFPECLEDWIYEDNPVRAIDVFVDALDLAELGFSGVDPEARLTRTRQLLRVHVRPGFLPRPDPEPAGAVDQCHERSSRRQLVAARLR